MFCFLCYNFFFNLSLLSGWREGGKGRGGSDDWKGMRGEGSKQEEGEGGRVVMKER